MKRGVKLHAKQRTEEKKTERARLQISTVAKTINSESVPCAYEQ